MVKRSKKIRSRHRTKRAPLTRPSHVVGTLVPAGVLSMAWTIGLVSSSLSAVPAADSAPEAAEVPDDSLVPAQTVEAPANYSVPATVAPGPSSARSGHIMRIASTQEIPSVALAAYQRSATVMAASHDACALPWQLVAAVGKVESDHGRADGSSVGKDGVARPGILGPALDGRRGTREIVDTDAGQYDRDRAHDRAVGPMQFIPTTWALVGVDADGDGERNPQDIDDAALAAGVYLCSGDSDLGSRAGQRAAVHRYNHSWDYVDLVMSVADKYAGQASFASPVAARPVTLHAVRPQTRTTEVRETGAGADTGSSPASTEAAGHTQTAPEQPQPQPAGTPQAPNKPPKDKKNPVETLLEDSPVGPLLTQTQARARCLAGGLLALDLPALRRCIDGLLKP
ncbi:hypothetical protein ASG90_06955 [Nocardioides sp. Soil797]|nr:hypothetical protein ASG90_06955 [Nocardioides sp. Soil797]